MVLDRALSGCAQAVDLLVEERTPGGLPRSLESLVYAVFKLSTVGKLAHVLDERLIVS